MKKFIMNALGTLGHGAGSSISGGTFVITSTPSAKVFAVAQGVFFKQIDFTFSGGNGPGCDPGTVTGSGTVLASSLKTFSGVGGDQVMRENDITTTGAFQGTSGGSPVVIGDQPVEVVSAGQNKASSE